MTKFVHFGNSPIHESSVSNINVTLVDGRYAVDYVIHGVYDNDNLWIRWHPVLPQKYASMKIRRYMLKEVGLSFFTLVCSKFVVKTRTL